MNKPLDQLELDGATPHQFSRPATPEEILTIPDEEAEALARMRAERETREQVAEEAGAEFDWEKDQSIILREQRATAVYWGKNGHIVVRQERQWDEESDSFTLIAPENLERFNLELDHFQAQLESRKK